MNQYAVKQPQLKYRLTYRDETGELVPDDTHHTHTYDGTPHGYWRATTWVFRFNTRRLATEGTVLAELAVWDDDWERYRYLTNADQIMALVIADHAKELSRAYDDFKNQTESITWAQRRPWYHTAIKELLNKYLAIEKSAGYYLQDCYDHLYASWENQPEAIFEGDDNE